MTLLQRAVRLRRRLRASGRRLPRPRPGDRARRCARPTPASPSSTTPEPQHHRGDARVRSRAARRRLPGRRHHRQPRLRLPAAAAAARRRAGAGGAAREAAAPTTPTSPRSPRAIAPRSTRCRRRPARRCSRSLPVLEEAAGVARRPAPHRRRCSARTRRTTRPSAAPRGELSRAAAPRDLAVRCAYSRACAAASALAARVARLRRRRGALRACLRASRRSIFMLRLTMLPCRASILASRRL